MLVRDLAYCRNTWVKTCGAIITQNMMENTNGFVELMLVLLSVIMKVLLEINFAHMYLTWMVLNLQCWGESNYNLTHYKRLAL